MKFGSRTKVVATLGPSVDDPLILEQLIASGVDVVRLNFSHGHMTDHTHRVTMIRNISQKLHKEVGILADLQGPKIRITQFAQQRVVLSKGALFTLDAEVAEDAGDQNQVGITYKNLPQEVKVGDILLLNDGLIALKVLRIHHSQIICEVIIGGELTNNKGINLQGGGLSAAALTAKDQHDLQAALAMDVDYIAVSFVRNAQDILQARQLIKATGNDCGIIAKIERQEAVENLDEIIRAADAVMVARGDLGVEMGDAKLPGTQKEIIHRARTLNKSVITATQMMESMIYQPQPTRAEVLDVANAVFDGTDAVMLSAETATGQYPLEVIQSIQRICKEVEKHPKATLSRHRIECHFERSDEAIAMAAMYAANHFDIKAIISLTESGATPLIMSRIRSGIPIYGLSRQIKTLRRMTLYRGVFPVLFDATGMAPRELNQQAIALLCSEKRIQSGDRVIITKGDMVGVHGQTNTLKIITVT